MKKIISLLMAMVLTLSCASALAVTESDDRSFTTSTDGATVLMKQADRNITNNTPAARNPIIAGESPTTGLPWNGTYLPMIVQISNPKGTVKYNGKSVSSSGAGARAPWGGQYADIVYEGILYASGETRISFLFSDSLDEGSPSSVGPVRSARIGHVLLREEWQSGFVYAGGPRREENNISEMFAELGASDKGVLFNLLDGKWEEYKNRVKDVKAPDNYNCNPVGLRTLIPTDYVAEPHAFLFTDDCPYLEGYDLAYTINLDWGYKTSTSHFTYDEENNVYYRYTGDAPYMTYASADDRSEENQTWMSFSNVIIQRVDYEYTNNSKVMPVMQNVGRGNADIFISGHYIPGYWIRESTDSPTVYYDDQGNELQFNRGKTYIAHMSEYRLCTYTGM